MLLLCSKTSIVVITNRLSVTKYSYFKWQWIFPFYVYMFLSSVTDKTFTGQCEQHGWCLIRNRNNLPFARIWGSPLVFGGVRVDHIFSSCCAFLFCSQSCLCLISSRLVLCSDAMLFSFYSITCLHVLSFALWCPLRFPHNLDLLWFVGLMHDLLFVFIHALWCPNSTLTI